MPKVRKHPYDPPLRRRAQTKDTIETIGTRYKSWIGVEALSEASLSMARGGGLCSYVLLIYWIRLCISVLPALPRRGCCISTDGPLQTPTNPCRAHPFSPPLAQFLLGHDKGRNRKWFSQEGNAMHPSEGYIPAFNVAYGRDQTQTTLLPGLGSFYLPRSRA